MKRLQSPRNLPYRTVEDARREPLRLGKYVYLLIIAAIALFLVDRAAGWLYMLRGDGFVYGDAWTLAFEYDVTIDSLPVREGDRVTPGAPLATVASAGFQERATGLAAEVAGALDRLEQARTRVEGLRAERRVALEELDFTERQYDRVRGGAERGLVVGDTVNDFAHDRFRARRAVERLDAEIRTIEAELATLRAAAERARGHYRALLDGFGGGRCGAPVPGDVAARRAADGASVMDGSLMLHAAGAKDPDPSTGTPPRRGPGLCRAPQGGVVANLDSTPGSVLRQGEPLLQVFGDERYVLAYLDNRSPVPHAAGDPILVRFQGLGWRLARIGRPTAVAERLPPEFQPRFAQVTRDRLVFIEVDPEILAEASMLTTVQLYKPAGLEAALGVYRAIRSRAGEAG
ncbi:MAG: hypothetical protein RID91_09450 [Azospirillaceae bacterium]